MKILHITDTHLGEHGHWSGSPEDWSRGDDFLEAFRLGLEPALRGEVDLVVHGGDLFDRARPSMRHIQAAAALLRRASEAAPVLVIPGNHDRQGLRRYLADGGPRLMVLAEPSRVVVAGLAVGLVPYRRQAVDWARDAREAVGGGVDLLVAHQSFDGHRVPGYTFRASRRPDTVGARHIPAGVGTILCGHLHGRQVVHVGGAAVVCPGSTERTEFAEQDQVKGVAIFEPSGAGWRWRWVDLPSREMAVVDAPRDLAAVSEGVLVRAGDRELAEAARARGGWVRGDRRSKRPAPRQRRMFR